MYDSCVEESGQASCVFGVFQSPFFPRSERDTNVRCLMLTKHYTGSQAGASAPLQTDTANII